MGFIFSLQPSSLAQPRRQRSRAYKTRIRPNWFADNTRFWYRNDLADGVRQFIMVDALNGLRAAAFFNF